MLTVIKGQQVLTPLGHTGIVMEISTINNLSSNSKGLGKAKVRYSPKAGTVNEAWFAFGKLKEIKINVLVIPDEEAFIIEPEHVNPEPITVKPVDPISPTDEASF